MDDSEIFEEVISAISTGNTKYISANREQFKKAYQKFNLKERGKLNKTALDIIFKYKLFKLFVTKDLNGLELSLTDALRIMEYSGYADGSLGWLISIGSGGGFFSGFMREDTAEELFKPDEAVIAGSGIPSGTAEFTDNGYKINGNWKYCSGCEHASVITVSCKIKKEGKISSSMKAFALKPEQIEIIEDWNAFGLKTTSSHTIKIKDQFVDEKYSFDLFTKPRISDYAMFSYPFYQFAQTSFAAVVLGISESYFSEVDKLIELRKEGWNKQDPKRYLFTKNLFLRNQEKLREAKREFYKVVDKSWKELKSNGEIEEFLRKEVSKVCMDISEICHEACSKLFPYLGMTVLEEDNIINQIWRDLQTANQHVFLKRYEE